MEEMEEDRNRRHFRKTPAFDGVIEGLEPELQKEFIDFLEGNGGFVYAGWCGDPAVEAEIKEQTKATIRVIPDEEFRSPAAPTTCIWTGRPAVAEVVWAKAY